MKHNISLTIIIPCYNSAKTIEDSIDSVLLNAVGAGCDIEIIIVDDCSTDDTVIVVENYIINNNGRIKIIKNKRNLGAGGARNTGLKYATKEYVTFLDSDDELTTDFWCTIIPYFESEHDVIVFDAYRRNRHSYIYMSMFYTSKIKTGMVDKRKALVYLNGSTCGKIYKRSLIKDNSIEFGLTSRMEDLVFTKRAIAVSKKIFYIQKPLYIYKNNPMSITNDRLLLKKENRLDVFELMKRKINNDEFNEELNSIYFLEVIYMRMLNKIKAGDSYKKIKDSYKKYKKNYDFHDKYMIGYNIKYIIAFVLFEMRLFMLIKLIYKLKEKLNEELRYSLVFRKIYNRFLDDFKRI